MTQQSVCIHCSNQNLVFIVRAKLDRFYSVNKDGDFGELLYSSPCLSEEPEIFIKCDDCNKVFGYDLYTKSILEERDCPI